MTSTRRPMFQEIGLIEDEIGINLAKAYKNYIFAL